MINLMNLRIALLLAAGCLMAPPPAFGQNAGQLIVLSVSQIDAGSPSFTLQVKGGNFVQGSTVYWGGRPLATTLVDGSTLNAVVTSDLLGISGQNQLTVQNPNGNVSGVAFVSIEPVLLSVAPQSVALGSGAQTISVSGAGFNPSDAVQVNPVGTALTYATHYVSPSLLTADLPASALTQSSNAAVLVVQVGCCSSQPVYLAIGNPPAINAVTPSNVAAGIPGFFMTVAGAGFQPQAVVYFNGSAIQTTYVTSSLLNVQVPASPALSIPGPIQLYVKNPDGGTSNAATLTVASAGAAINNLSPAAGVAGMGDFSLTVNGSGFVSGAKVLWNSAALNTTFGGAGQLVASVPAALTAVGGSAQVAVQNPGAAASAAVTFSFPAPHISALSPTAIGAGSADFTLAVGGSAFLNTSTVFWGATPLATNFVSAAQVNAAVPAALIVSPAAVNITVSNSGTLSNAVVFNVAAPVISTINPSNASVGSNGFTMTVTGSGYTPATQLQWNMNPLPVVFLATTQLTASIPPNLLTLAGTAQVSVINPGGAVSNSLTFTLNPPVISQLNPASVPSGSTLANLGVAGSGFATGSLVFWNNTPLVTNFISTSLLNAKVSPELLAAPGAAAISVSSPGGAKSNSVTFTVGSGTPAITSLTPAAGAAGGTAFTLTVNGGGFPADAVVQWNGVGLPTTVVSSAQLTAAVSAALVAAPGSASIAISSSAGASNMVAFPIAKFTVLNAASNLTAIAPGSLISIYGSNLAPVPSVSATAVPLTTSLGNTTVQINGIAAPLLYVSPNQINAQVPFETAVGAATLAVAGVSPVSVPVSATGPGIFVVQNFADGAANSADDPAAAGQYVVVYMTGQGAVDHPVASGAAAIGNPLSSALAPVTATIGGKDASVLFAGLTPGLVGVLQVDLQVPAVAAGNQPLIVTIGGVPSSSVGVAVK